MTSQQQLTRQETLDWVHSELAQVKSGFGQLQLRMDQAASLAVDAADKADQLRLRLDQIETRVKILDVVQEELRATRDQMGKLQDELNHLRQQVAELGRHRQEDMERFGEERNQTSQRFAESARVIELWREKIVGFEEQHRRGVEASAQLALKLETLENEQGAQAVRHSRIGNAVGRIDQEVTRLTAVLEGLVQEDEVLRERIQSANEFLRRLEGEADQLRNEIARIDRISDRLELVQAERTRHGERLTELTTAIEQLDASQYEQGERSTLLEARMAGFQTEIAGLDEKLNDFRERLATYLRATNQAESELRKREITALEKEVREIRGRSLDFAEEE